MTIHAGQHFVARRLSHQNNDVKDILNPSCSILEQPRTPGHYSIGKAGQNSIGANNLVPHVPPRLPADPLDVGFHPLPKAVWIKPTVAQARIKPDIQCNHHAYCYAAMLDFTSVAPTITTAQCILGKA